MDIYCKHCDQQNPTGSIYCNHCGMKLVEDDHVNEEYVSETTRQLVKKIFEELNEEAIEVKFKTLESFEEKATSWVNNQFVALSVAISIVVAVLSYAGFSSYNASEEYQKMLDKANLEIADDIKNIERSRQNFNTEASQAKDEIDGKMKELEGFDSSKITKYQLSLEQTLQRVNTIEKQSEDRLKAIKKLENSRFRIQLHYRDDNHQLWQDNIEYIRQRFDTKGFRLTSRNIANVTTDKQEIIIYSSISEEKANIIRELILPRFKSININTIPTSYNDDFDMVIKLCPQSNVRGSRCIP